MDAQQIASMITVALNLAGGRDRGTEEAEDDDIRDRMRQLEVPQELFVPTRLLVNAFLGFAMDVRAAERKGRPIIPIVGETDLPKQKP